MEPNTPAAAAGARATSFADSTNTIYSQIALLEYISKHPKISLSSVERGGAFQ
jgi:hypothetical protein